MTINFHYYLSIEAGLGWFRLVWAGSEAGLGWFKAGLGWF